MGLISNNIKYGVLFLIILCNSIFAQYFPVFNYLDEIIAIICIPIILYNTKKYKKISIVITILILVCSIGLIGNCIYIYQENMLAILKDIFAFCKMGIVYAALYYLKNKYNDDSNLKLSTAIAKIYVTIIFIFGIVSINKDIGMSHDLRNGVMSYKFLYSHPTFLVYAIVLILVVLMANSQSKINLFFEIEGLIVLYLSQRDKAFAFILLFILFKFLFKFGKKIKVWQIVLGLIGMLYISYDKIIDYLNYSWSPRWALYTNGFKIMLDTFPVGSGFATFGSSLSGEYYSLIYYLYDMYGKIGVSPNDYVDLGDAQWPYYYAQFGLIGTLMFISMLYIMFTNTRKLYKYSKIKLKASYLLIGYIIIASVVENVFTNESGVTAIVILLLFLGRNNCEEKFNT
ncbi:hypothetical protein FC778_08540 [Clostridium botulinum]|nr:hypothetical protein [Clostridium botulinum]